MLMKKLPSYRLSSFLKAHKVWMGLQTYSEALRGWRRQFRAKEIETVQARRLQILMSHAYNNVEYYRNLFDQEGIRPGDIRSAADLRHVPLLTKRHLQDNSMELIANRPPRCKINKTSGSTGTPVTTLQDIRVRIYNSTGLIRAHQNAGLRLFGERILYLTYVETDSPKLVTQMGYLQGVHLYGRYPIRSLRKDAEFSSKELTKLLKWNPTVLLGNPDIIAIFAEELQKSELELRPKAIITIDSVLGAKVREFLTRVFHTNIILESYSTFESGEIAMGCGHHLGMHTNADSVVVEILKDGRPAACGEYGEVVVTPLKNFSMPMIRLNLEDVAAILPEECPCGSKLPLISSIQGRLMDDIKLKNGKRIPCGMLYNNVNPLFRVGVMNNPYFKKYQIVQEEMDHIVIRYERGSAYSPDILGQLERRFEDLFEGQATVEFVEVPVLEPGPSGKYRFVISKVHE
jgi:phenylacetate-CoA ligase